MTVDEIERAVDALPPAERSRFAAWMAAKHPLVDVEELIRCAAELVAAGKWSPRPPTADNQPSGAVLARALRVAERLNLGE